MPKFRKKPIIIEAVELTWGTWSEVCDLIAGTEGTRGCHVDANGKESSDTTDRLGLVIPTLEGTMLGIEGDFIIKGVHGEIYPCKADIFHKTYEPVA
jgi:hypothetical protein